MTTLSSILAWRIPGALEPLMGYGQDLQRVLTGLSDRTKQQIKGAGSWNYRD